jgi:phosphoglycolate phosphatase
MRYRLVVWDFDGTLADTLAASLAIYNRLAPRHGALPVSDPAAVRGMTTREFLARHRVPLFRLPLLARDVLAAQRGQMTTVRLFPGVLDVLAALGRRGVRLGVLSSNTTTNIRACLGANHAEELFEFVTGYPRIFGKGRALARLLRARQLAPAEVLYVGDEVRDIEAARRAGTDVAAVGWGFHAPDLLARQNPTFLLNGPHELLDLPAR